LRRISFHSGLLKAMALVVLGVFSASGSLPAEEAWTPPETVIHPGWYARIHTSMGLIIVRLLPEQAPQSVAHFAAAAEGELEWNDIITGKPVKERYFDGAQVHMAIAGRQFEAGDRTGSGTAAPSVYVPYDEGRGPVNFSVKGRMGLTRASGRRISAVQFFISASAQPWLSGHYPCIGVVVYGNDAALRITSVKTYGSGRPLEPVVIEKIRIFSIGDVEPLQEPIPYKPSPLEIAPRKKNGDAASSAP